MNGAHLQKEWGKRGGMDGYQHSMCRGGGVAGKVKFREGEKRGRMDCGEGETSKEVGLSPQKSSIHFSSQSNF